VKGSTATDPSNLGSHVGGERTPVPVSVGRRRSIATTSNRAAEYDTATLTAASTSIPTMTTDHSAGAGEIRHYAPVKYVRIFADEQGLSHFEDVELDLKRRHVADGVPPLQLVGPLAASGVLFVEQMGEQGDAAPWERHVTPSRRWIVVLEGELERVVSDGERRVFGPGDVVLREDTTGEGSLTTPRGACVRFLMIPTGD
jgi:hypothetical protein